MVESEIHRLIKEKVAEALREKGYQTFIEHSIPEGRLDVYATKDGEEPIKVEVAHTHIPDWILLEVKGDLPRPKRVSSGIPPYWKEKAPWKEIEDEELGKAIEEVTEKHVQAEMHRRGLHYNPTS